MLRKLLFFACLLLLSCNGEIEYTYYADGSIKSEIPKSNNLNHGVAKGYFEIGELKYEENWVNGELDGVVRYYFENGKLQNATLWKQGKKEGISVEYKESGKLWSKSIYESDILISVFLFRENGEVLERQIYNSNEDMIYFAKMDSTGFKYLEAALPLIKAERDTISLGEQYRVHISFGLKMKGEMNVYTGKLTEDKELTDSIKITKLDDFIFSYMYQPKKSGQGTIPFVFEHITDENDSLRINNFRHRKTFYVKPSTAPAGASRS